MQTAATSFTDHLDVFSPALQSAQWVFARVVHGRGQRHGRRQESLYLIQPEIVPFEPQCQIQHVFVAGAGVRGDKIRDQVLLLAGGARCRLKELLEALVGANTRLHHLGERTRFGVLGRNLQIAADMVRHELLDVLRGTHGQVVAQAGADQDLFDAR